MTRRPTFLGIGAHKCGTTWLSEIVASHPDAFVAHGKEIQFFSHHHDRGNDWYLRHFAGAGDARAVGEYSVSYLEGDETVAERIRRFDPALRLLVCLRDPVERAYSHYRWLLQRGAAHESFAACLRDVPAVVELGLYHRNLGPYWQRFPDDAIHFVRFEDIAAAPERAARSVFRFLGIDEAFESPLTGKVVGDTIDPRSPGLERLRDRLWNLFTANGLGVVVSWAKRSGLSQAYRRLNDRGVAPAAPARADRELAWPHFEADAEQLAQRTGLDVSRWGVRD